MANTGIVSTLIRQYAAMRRVGADVKAVEVGRKTWIEFLFAVNCEPEGITEGWFMGMHIRPADVPEGQLWPLESAK